MSSHLLKHKMLAVLMSAVVAVLTLGVSAAQAAVFHVRAPSTGPAGQGTSGWDTALTIALLAFVVGDIIYATVVERRALIPAVSVGEPARLPVSTSEREQGRKAA